MVDKPPPQRWRVEERGGQLIVIDTLTGAPPPTAAERHGSGHGHMASHTPTPAPAPVRSAPISVQPVQARPAAVRTDPVRPQLEPNSTPRKSSAMPWSSNEATPRGASAFESRLESKLRELSGATEAARPASRALRAAGSPVSITTKRWYDAKGPRTIMLGPAAQARQQKMLMWGIIALVLTTIAIFVISPVILFVLAFALLRGGREVVAQAGAKWVDSLEMTSG